jgi:hypothetical protein
MVSLMWEAPCEDGEPQKNKETRTEAEIGLRLPQVKGFLGATGSWTR